MGPQEGEEHPFRESADVTPCAADIPGPGLHLMRREVRNHPVKVGFKQDRLVCGRERCDFVLYDWAGAFKPSVRAPGHDGVQV